MISHLDRKLWRDLRRMKGQAFAVAMVMGCGLAMMVMARSLIFSLESTRREYYEANRFAEVFVHLKRAPNSLAARIKEIPGVAAVQPGISVQVTLDLPTLDEPASGLVLSLPDFAPPELNRLFLRRGRWLAPGSRREMLVGEAFADGSPWTATAAKSLAGRGFEEVSRQCQQAYGAIGFTFEHDFHRFLRRGYLLDACFGDWRSLQEAIGRELATTRTVPRIGSL
jgi:putative ABC transport system permease protein